MESVDPANQESEPKREDAYNLLRKKVARSLYLFGEALMVVEPKQVGFEGLKTSLGLSDSMEVTRSWLIDPVTEKDFEVKRIIVEGSRGLYIRMDEETTYMYNGATREWQDAEAELLEPQKAVLLSEMVERARPLY